MHYLEGEEVLVLHYEVIEATGGSHGLRELNLFLSIIERPKMAFGGEELYSDVYTKAAAYLESLAKFHVFVDGNKRTSFVAAARFLFLNGYDVTFTSKEVEIFILRVIEKRLDIIAIAAWFKKHVKKL